MDQREHEWLQEKIGVISTSELSRLMPTTASGKWTAGNKSYLYKIQRQRFLKQPSPPVYSRTMQIGIENEPYAVAWLRANTDMSIMHCSTDFSKKIFVKTEWGLGCSPDVYETAIQEYVTELKVVVKSEVQINSLIEIKCVAGEESTNFYFSPTISFEKKRMRAFDEHRDQMAGQLLAHEGVDIVRLMKYDPQDDNDPFDLRSPIDPSRGILFDYTREEFGTYLDTIKERVIFADQFLDSGRDIDLINNDWELYLQQKLR